MINLALKQEFAPENNASDSNFMQQFLTACNKSFGAEITTKWFANLTVFSQQGSEVIFLDFDSLDVLCNKYLLGDLQAYFAPKCPSIQQYQTRIHAY